MERRTTLADARRPPASARPSVGGGSCARRAWPSLLRMRLLQPWFNLSGEGVGDAGLRPPSLLRIHGRAPRARRPGSRRRHALEDPPGGSIADAAFAEAPSSARNAKGGRDPEARQARKGRELALRLPGPCRRGRRKRPGAHGRGYRRQRQRRRHRLRPRAGGRPVLPRRLGIHGHGRLAPGCQRPRRHRAEHARKRPSGHVGGAHGREKASLSGPPGAA